MKNKLQGKDYLDFWRNRIAKGAHEVAYAGSDMAASEAHADDIMRQLEPVFEEIDKRFAELDHDPVIVELGCGWGRMLSRLAKRFPKAFLHGYDICGDAIVGAVERLHSEGLEDRVALAVESQIPEGRRKHTDLVFTCTCLQHITDDSFFTNAMMSIREAMAPKTGLALMFENTYIPEKGGKHVRFRGAMDFLGWFAKPENAFHYFWDLDLTVMDHGEPHQAMLVQRL